MIKNHHRGRLNFIFILGIRHAKTIIYLLLQQFKRFLKSFQISIKIHYLLLFLMILKINVGLHSRNSLLLIYIMCHL